MVKWCVIATCTNLGGPQLQCAFHHHHHRHNHSGYLNCTHAWMHADRQTDRQTNKQVNKWKARMTPAGVAVVPTSSQYMT